MNTNLKLVAIVSAALAMTACGGGGGGGGTETTTTVSTTTTTTVAGSSIVTSVPASSYAGGSDKAGAFAYLNAQRSACGFGMLAQNTNIDTAAQGHTDYMSQNGMTLGHNQDGSKPGFTGATLSDRLVAAGYPTATAGEVLTANNTTYGAGTFGQGNIMSLFTTPYHGMGLLLGYRHVGMGTGTIGAGYNILTVDMGTTNAAPKQLLPNNVVATYPCNGSSGILTKTYQNEDPAPIAGRNLQFNPIGHPIYLKVRDGQTIALTTAQLRVNGTNTDLTLRTLAKSNDANNTIADDSVIILMPDAPLQANTSYQFLATGTNNGQAFNISMIFTTGAQ